MGAAGLCGANWQARQGGGKALTYGFEEAAAHLKELGYTKVQVLGKNGFTPCEL